MGAGQRDYPISFIAAQIVTDDYGTSENWNSTTLLASSTAMVKFGTAQEKREAAKESSSQAASFECLRTPVLDAVPLTARIDFDGSQWDITERAPLDRKTIRFAGIRLVDPVEDISSGSSSGHATVSGVV